MHKTRPEYTRTGSGNSLDDLSNYLRQAQAPAAAPRQETYQNASQRPGRGPGHMNNFGSTLIVGRSTHHGAESGRASLRNFSEPMMKQKMPALTHFRSVGDTQSRGPGTGQKTPRPHEKSPETGQFTVSEPQILTVWFHEPASYTQDVVFDPVALAGARVGELYELEPIRKEKDAQKLIFIVKCDTIVTKSPTGPTAGKPKSSFPISLTSGLQKLLDVPPRSSVQVRHIRDFKSVMLDTVEIHIKDVNFSRDSQWSLASDMVGSCCYVDQRVTFMGTRIGSVQCLFQNGKKVFSGYVGAKTNIVFRSESAKLVFLVQLAREMWHFEENGEIMFHKLVNTLFPMIFKKWRNNSAHHAITIVLFTTVDFTRAPWTSLGGGERPSHCQDYYRVVVDQVSVFIWDKIMANLRLEFANFKRDILLHMENNEYKITGEPCPSVKGNLLEAINLSLTLVSDRYKNTDLRHMINHLVVVTPGTGLFDVDYDLMLSTSKKMFSLDYALDIVCLSQPPLHTVPLFRYRAESGDVRHCVPKWCDMSFYGAATRASRWIPRCKIYELQMMGLMENEANDAQLDRLEFKENIPVIDSMDKYDEAVFCPVRKPLVVKTRFETCQKRLPAPKNRATLSLMRQAVEPQRAVTNVSTINSSANGFVSNTSVANSALSSLYTLNKPEDAGAVKKPVTTAPLKNARSLSTFSQSSNSNAKVSRVTADANLRNELSKTVRIQKPRIRENERGISMEKRKSALEIEICEREENNPYWSQIENPSKSQVSMVTNCSRWADVFPPKIRRKLFKWRSIKAPAALPVGTTLFPTSAQMETEYTFQIYVVSLNCENRLELKTMKDLLREMVRLRLSMGFQICYGDRVKKFEADRKSGGYPEGVIKYFPSGDCSGARIYLSLNDEIHRIVLDYNGSLNVQLYKKVKTEEQVKILLGSQSSRKKQVPLIRTRYADEYTPSKVSDLDSNTNYFNWNQMDQLIAGYEDAVPDISQHFRQMKFVVMPGPLPANAYHISNEKLSEEEIRLEGLRKLIALIERGRCKNGEEDSAKSGEEIFQEINFYTGNLHDFLNEQAEHFDVSGTKPSNSLIITDGSRFNMNIKLSQLAQELQTQGGLKLVDRTWHFKIHPHCFLGSDLTSWLMKSFDDIDSREAATEYGQMLMDEKLFCHVRDRHGFLDGHYFYKFCDEYVDQAYKAKVERKSWFKSRELIGTKGKDATSSKDTKENNDGEDEKDKKDGKTVKSPGTSASHTPLLVAVNTPTLARSDSITSAGDTPVELKKTISSYFLQDGEAMSLSESQKARKGKKFMISKQVRYNCDPSKKSFRPELLDVHYDTVHNPEHCYHIRLQWLNTTTKFIDETIISWSRFCERYGLNFVETPWRELCTIPEVNPFHSFVDLQLAVNPFQDPEFMNAEILKTNKFYFHLHFLKVADFLLDNRGTSFFSKEHTEICYSWGRPSFKYAQFIHKSGAYMVELRDTGEFCMAPNNVHILRSNTFVSPGSELSGKNSTLDSQRVMLRFRECCRDEAFLRQVFRDTAKYLQEDYAAAYVMGM